MASNKKNWNKIKRKRKLSARRWSTRSCGTFVPKCGNVASSGLQTASNNNNNNWGGAITRTIHVQKILLLFFNGGDLLLPGATPTNIFIISFSWKFAFFCCVALCCACHFRFALCHFAISGFDGSAGISIP